MSDKTFNFASYFKKTNFMKSSATFTRTNKSLKSYLRLNRLRKRKRIYDITLTESKCKEYQEYFGGNYLDILRYNYFAVLPLEESIRKTSVRILFVP